MLILPISSPNKYQFSAKIQIFFDNFQCEIGLSSRMKRMYQSYNSFADIQSCYIEVIGAFFTRSDKSSIDEC